MPTGTWPNPQNAKRPYLKFRLGTYVPAPLPLREPLHQPSMQASSLGHSGDGANKEEENQSALESVLAGWDQPCLLPLPLLREKPWRHEVGMAYSKINFLFHQEEI